MRALYNYVPKSALLVWLICTVLFFMLAADVRYGGLITRIDKPISEYFHNAGTARSIFLQVGTNLGSGIATKSAYAMILVLLVLRRWHYLPVLWLAVNLGGMLNSGMQTFFARPRPRFADTPILANTSFPSGHTAGATLFFGLLILLALRELRSRDVKCFSIALASLCILFVAFTRVALLMHYPTDVIGSMIWCTAWLVGCDYGNRAACRWSKNYTENWSQVPPHRSMTVQTSST